MNLETIDRQIAKLQRMRDFLSDASDSPEMLELIRQALVGANPNSSSSQASEPSHESTAAAGGIKRRGDYTKDVLAACPMAGNFTAADVVKAMEKAAYAFEAGDHTVSVNSRIRSLVKKKALRIVEPGSGRNPTIYAKIVRSPRTEEGQQI